MRVDFHVHSTASDGTFTPTEIANRAARENFAAIALTDHDNCDGIDEFFNRQSSTCNLISGVELSIDPGEGFDKFHLLGLGVDPKNPELKDFLQQVLDGRNARNARIQSNFHRLGIDMPLDPRISTPPPLHLDVIARPHYAKWLVEHGLAVDIKDAFEKFLLPDSPDATRCYEERWHPPQEMAIAVIHAAGGLAVMAHPRYWKNAWKHEGVDFAAAERALAVLKEKGLDGLESLYAANTPEENVEFTRLADRLGLLKSAGSDFHGSNKPDIPLGMDVSESFISPLLRRLSVTCCLTRRRGV